MTHALVFILSAALMVIGVKLMLTLPDQTRAWHRTDTPTPRRNTRA